MIVYPLPSATALKSPQHWGDFRGPRPIPGEGEGEVNNAKTNLPTCKHVTH
jgi:hypothetical protein